MATFRETDNFVWDLNDVLGKGATATVYRGFQKESGEPVAIKCYSELPIETQTWIECRKREFDVFKKLNHENVVKLIAIEKEHLTQQDVIIMELCRGPCLFTLLQQHRYKNGLNDEEFLVVLRHVTAAVKHLRENKVSHRDLKPGNIVRHMNASGEPVYKVTDFGTALEAEDGQEFVTFCGTTPYMHPNVIAKFLFNNTENVPYNAYVDLWSLGVTLYQLATGALPFRPCDFRDFKMMHILMARKPSGAISAVQVTADPIIEWSNQLPNTCSLSPSLQKLMLPLFVGLFENDSSKVWSFEKYFECVDNILSYKALNLYYVNSSKPSVHYLPPNATVDDLKIIIENETMIDKSKQLLLRNGTEVLNLMGMKTAEDTPVFVIDCGSKDIHIGRIEEVTFTEPDFKQITEDWQQQTNLVQKWVSNAMSLSERILKCVIQTITKNAIVENIQKLIENKVTVTTEKQHHCSDIFDLLKQLFDFVIDINGCVSNFKVDTSQSMQECKNNYEKASISFNELRIRWSDIEEAVIQLKKKEKKLNALWTTAIDAKKLLGHYSVAESNCQQISEYCGRVVMQCMFSNDSPIIKLEKLKVENIYRKHMSLYTEKCLPFEMEISDKLEDWYPNAIHAIEFSDWLSKRITEFKQFALEFLCTVNTLKEQQKLVLNEKSEANKTKKIKNVSRKSEITQDLVSFVNSHERLSALIQENQHLIDGINRLSY